MQTNLSLLKSKVFSFREIMILVPLIVLIIFLSMKSPYFLTIDNIFNILRQFSIYAIISVGMTMVIITGGIDLSVGAVLGLCGVMAATMVTTWGIHPFAAFFLVLAFGAFVGSINGILITRFKIAPFIATLGMLSIAKGSNLLICGGLPVKFYSPLAYLGHGYIGRVPVSVIIMFVIALMGHIFLTKTATGRNIFAIGNNMKAAKLSGIKVENHIFLVYAIIGMLAAVSGTLIAGNLRSADPTSGLGYELDVIAACVIGGTSLSGGEGTILGTILGAALIGTLRNGFVLLGVSGYWQIVTIGAVIIAAVMLDSLRTSNKNS